MFESSLLCAQQCVKYDAIQWVCYVVTECLLLLTCASPSVVKVEIAGIDEGRTPNPGGGAEGHTLTQRQQYRIDTHTREQHTGRVDFVQVLNNAIDLDTLL